jgi:DNA repair photolyase
MLEGVDFTLNPYVGCQFGCSYCYAAFFHPDEERVANWGKWVQVKENALELVMRSRNLPGASLLIGSATDCYQPIEAKLGLTRSILSYLATLRPQPRITLITRSPIIERDIDVLQKLPEMWVHLSVTTDDDEIRKAFEPGCASIRRRLEAIENLSLAGVKVGANLCPLLPVREPLEFVREVKRRGAKKAWINGFHESSGPFASGTRDNAKSIARELNWTPERSKWVIEAMTEEAKRLGLR